MKQQRKQNQSTSYLNIDLFQGIQDQPLEEQIENIVNILDIKKSPLKQNQTPMIGRKVQKHKKIINSAHQLCSSKQQKKHIRNLEKDPNYYFYRKPSSDNIDTNHIIKTVNKGINQLYSTPNNQFKFNQNTNNNIQNSLSPDLFKTPLMLSKQNKKQHIFLRKPSKNQSLESHKKRHSMQAALSTQPTEDGTPKNTKKDWESMIQNDYQSDNGENQFYTRNFTTNIVNDNHYYTQQDDNIQQKSFAQRPKFKLQFKRHTSFMENSCNISKIQTPNIKNKPQQNIKQIYSDNKNLKKLNLLEKIKKNNNLTQISFLNKNNQCKLYNNIRSQHFQKEYQSKNNEQNTNHYNNNNQQQQQQKGKGFKLKLKNNIFFNYFQQQQNSQKENSFQNVTLTPPQQHQIKQQKNMNIQQTLQMGDQNIDKIQKDILELNNVVNKMKVKNFKLQKQKQQLNL